MKLPNFSNEALLLLHADPPVIYMMDWVFRSPSPAPWLLLQALRRRRCHVLVQLSWTHESAGMTARLEKRVLRYTRRYPGHEITILANTPAEQQAVASRGLEALYCSGAVFLSPSVFYPIPDCRKEFRAIYDAVVSPYKRHELAREVENLALITYRKATSTRAHIRSTLAALGDAAWLNGRPDGKLEWFDQPAVNRNLNRARVGLCLSAVEGMMFASAQYLLAGLPVVTTPSAGGRHVFYERDYVRTVAENPAAVAAAVEEFCAAPPDPAHIRQRTLQKFSEHRGRFLERMRDLVAGRDPDGIWKNGWPEALPHKLDGGRFSLRENLAAVGRPGQIAPWLADGTLVQDG
jgi:hypothetical protein